MLEALAFISTELHRRLKPMWYAGSEAQKHRQDDLSAILRGFGSIARRRELRLAGLSATGDVQHHTPTRGTDLS
jgi:hypothetical protein